MLLRTSDFNPIFYTGLEATLLVITLQIVSGRPDCTLHSISRYPGDHRGVDLVEYQDVAESLYYDICPLSRHVHQPTSSAELKSFSPAFDLHYGFI